MARHRKSSSVHNGIILLFLSVLLDVCHASNLILLDDTAGLGRTFDGIGGLSGGSATSKLLADYVEPQRTEVLDYLFKPSFGASLHILKVEIGGDAQASDATEASHMHNSTDENYQRGYEWWLMKQAKLRNPSIKLYGLPWDFPAWIGNGTQNPYDNVTRLATYITKWVKGAKTHHNLDIDYIGIWNERQYNIPYIKTLRKMLDDSGLEQTRIVAADWNWDITADVTQDAELESAVDIIGVHYPGTNSPTNAVESGKPLWSSEDYSTYNDDVGGGCWARILNQNYVNGMMTSTIAWNLIDSYLEGLPWDRDSLMTAREPWSGHYTVNSPIWVSAHTAQFSSPGWKYLRHGYGVGKLEGGGSIVSLVSPDSSDLTIIIETMSHDHSKCIRPPLPAYNITKQNITLQLMGSFVDVQELQLWYTKLSAGGSLYFMKLPSVKVVSGQVHLSLGVDEIYTLTTVTSGKKGQHNTPPASKPFPIQYYSFFDSLNTSSEAPYFSNQQGVFEVVPISDWDKHLRQTVLEMPIWWCTQTPKINATMSVCGSEKWSDIFIRSEALVLPLSQNGSSGVYIAARIDKAGCETYLARGLFFFLYPNDQLFLLTKDLAGTEIIKGGRDDKNIQKVDNMMELLVYNGYVSGKVNKVQIFNVSIPQDVPSHGFVGLGTDSYGYADWDFFLTRNASDPLNFVEEDETLYFASEHN